MNSNAAKIVQHGYAKPGNGLLGESLRHARLHMDLPIPKLVEMALQRGEGVLADNGALCVRTGTRTGRSPMDRYIVDDPLVDAEIDWGKVNHPFDPRPSMRSGHAPATGCAVANCSRRDCRPEATHAMPCPCSS